MGADGEFGRNTVLKEYHTIFVDAWRYFKTYAEQMPMDEAAWERAIRMTSEFVKQHPENEAFARALILAVEHELEVQDKAIRKEKS